MSELEPPRMDVPPQPKEASSPVEGTYAVPEEALAPAPPRARSGAGMFFFGAFSGCLIVMAGLLLVAIMAAMGNESPRLVFANNKVAVIPIDGEILDARETVDALERYADNASVKAIVIRINSPGGAIAPSQEIYSAIRRARGDSGKPIVASLDSVAASGGYYIAAACDRIVANPGSITGSIGVILLWFDVKELLQWAKLKPETITSGTLKDAGSPFRQITPAERQYFQSIVSQLHTQFIRDVARGRAKQMKYEEVERIADGRVFTGEQALALKLVDELGSIDDAVRTAGKLAGIEGEPTKLWPRPREERLLDLLAAGDANALLERIASRRVPQFLYRW